MNLVLTNISKRFGGVAAVSDVSMTVQQGMITGLIGPNGAGKTTVVNLITGILALSSGTITIGETHIGSESPHRIAARGISRTFQNIQLLPEATAVENIMIGFHRHERATLVAQIMGFSTSCRETRDLRERARNLMTIFEMENFAERPAGGLAYGHQRKLEIMRAVASEPAVLILDEPVAGMNDVEAFEMGRILRKLVEDGMALLLIEHNVRFVSNLCNAVYVLDSGRMIASGAPHDVMADPAVRTAYLGTM
ncbi:amino acid/amide ABC transporter ATP-binding protein 1 (HAAT family) [Advenella incenata]|uniref:Amino acid/amide ABC transporter ATP-binding protein 1 (HAAT family) n=1 Tax=Advenella incenata TaxID=267800 RepID=A0A4Q7VFU4_9BURK|nr:ABC transporter ATP-binding protein [Advenella incenata]RZT94866.1 amino acid/amide ABC transporter ATP-binding protein 1 (HAAT family) [Advenella incenata]